MIGLTESGSMFLCLCNAINVSSWKNMHTSAKWVALLRAPGCFHPFLAVLFIVRYLEPGRRILGGRWVVVAVAAFLRLLLFFVLFLVWHSFEIVCTQVALSDLLNLVSARGAKKRRLCRVPFLETNTFACRGPTNFAQLTTVVLVLPCWSCVHCASKNQD